MSGSPEILPHQVVREDRGDSRGLLRVEALGRRRRDPTQGSLDVGTMTSRRAHLVERLYDDEDPPAIRLPGPK